MPSRPLSQGPRLDPSRRDPLRRGVTLVELLVVFTVVAILLALLSVTAMRFRETNNRVLCQNNLKQIGAAFQAHNDQHDAFPSGGTYWYDTARIWKEGTNNTVPAVYDIQSWGWGYQILPYLGHRDIWAHPDDRLVGDNPILYYHCPSARPFVRFWYAQAGGSCFRYMWDYSGNGGSWGNWPNITLAGNALDGPIVPSKNRFSGLGSNRVVSIANIEDGPSNVMLVAEKYLDINARLLQPICSDDQGWVDGWDNDAVAFCRGISPGNPPQPPKQYDNNVGCGFYFGSAHNAMQCVFCDGSIHTIAYDIDLACWSAICSTNDGNPPNRNGLE